MSNRMLNKDLLAKWAPILEEGPAIRDDERKLATAQILENTERALASGMLTTDATNPLLEAAPTNNTTGVQNYDPILISLLRRAAPKLIAYDILGVQPMTGPTGQIFALRSRYTNQSGTEAFYNEANTGFATVRGGNTAIVGDANLNVGTTPSGDPNTYNFAGGMTTPTAEALGSANNADWAEMAISIEKITVEARTRALKAEYTHEFAQDLLAIHGLDAAKELSNVLSTELISEINRELVRTIYVTAETGSSAATGGINTATPGTIDLDVDVNGRWSAERWVGLHFRLETEANAIAKRTRRGKGNILICSSNVASAFAAAKILNVTDAAGLQIDDTGNTYAGNIGRIKVFIDPYATSEFAVLGYKGANSWDAGLYYAPYTPLMQVRAVHTDTLSPVIGFKTRYGVVANPFSRGATASNGSLVANSNVYYRRSLITNIM